MIEEIVLPFDVVFAPAAMLKAGKLTCMYEEGRIRYICMDNTELIRMIYSAVRDEHWGTIPCQVMDETIVSNEASFTITYRALYGKPVPVYEAFMLIEGRADSSILFSMKGHALEGFHSNRIGLCVHHPVKECSGESVMITRPDGSMYTSGFPVAVSPAQPFLDVQQMKWTIAGIIQVAVGFEGDVFETEDQRNWSDSSYKTYSTPLHRSYPVHVQAGDKKEQVITLKTLGEKSAGSSLPHNPAREERVPFPKIGYGHSLVAGPVPRDVKKLLQKIPFDHLRVTLSINETGWLYDLQMAGEQATLYGTRLALVVFFSQDAEHELALLLAALQEGKTCISSILVLQKNQPVTPPNLLQYAYPLIKKALPSVQVGYGTDLFFADLNRQRPRDVLFDFICFSLHPQVHSSDNRSLLENLDNQADLVATARLFAVGKPVYVSPVTLADRYQHTKHDERQYTALAAWWTLMSMQQLSAAAGITFYELFGKSGLLYINRDANNGAATIQYAPLYSVLAAIHAFEPVNIIKRYAGDELLMDGLLLENKSGKRLFFKTPPAILSFKK
ncbi:MAG: hypothetical protein ABIQ88_18760 [Chitinophagaceae bacterium]